MSRTSATNQKAIPTPAMLLTAHEMAARSGIGENTLRQLMEDRKIEYLQIGNRRLLCEQAVWEFYQRHKTAATA